MVKCRTGDREVTGSIPVGVFFYIFLLLTLLFVCLFLFVCCCCLFVFFFFVFLFFFLFFVVVVVVVCGSSRAKEYIIEPRHEKTSLRGFRPESVQPQKLAGGL